MSAVAAAVYAPTLAESVDALLLLARNGVAANCVWCGSRQVEAFRAAAGEEPAGETHIITCRECGSELVSSRPAAQPDRCP